MGQDMKYLLDTNILIYYGADKIPDVEIAKIEEILEEDFNVSIITKIEFLGWQFADEEAFHQANSFIDIAHVLPLDEEVADGAIALRRMSNIKLPDAVIASTCLVHGLVLVTRNEKDFTSVEELSIYNPFS
jgi:hypothetical protein